MEGKQKFVCSDCAGKTCELIVEGKTVVLMPEACPIDYAQCRWIEVED